MLCRERRAARRADAMLASVAFARLGVSRRPPLAPLMLLLALWRALPHFVAFALLLRLLRRRQDAVSAMFEDSIVAVASRELWCRQESDCYAPAYAALRQPALARLPCSFATLSYDGAAYCVTPSACCRCCHMSRASPAFATIEKVMAKRPRARARFCAAIAAASRRGGQTRFPSSSAPARFVYRTATATHIYSTFTPAG